MCPVSRGLGLNPGGTAAVWEAVGEVAGVGLERGECRGWCWWGQAAASKRAMTGDQLAKAENVAGNVTLGERLIRAFGDTREDGRPARV